MATIDPSASERRSASPLVRAASRGLPSPCRRAATAVNPTLTISAIETISQIQKIAAVTAASPADPMRVPTQ